jgi:hypothetical protein
MNDQRFDDELRSILLEDAPRDVPDDLRRRVAAVPATRPVANRFAGQSWRHSVPAWIGAVAAVVVVLALASWWFRPTPPSGFGGAPTSSASPGQSASPFAMTPTPSPSAPPLLPTPTPAPSSVGDCRATDLEGRITAWQGAAGSRIAEVQVTNSSSRACVVRGTPGLQLVDADGLVLIDSATAGPSGQPQVTPADPGLELAPGGHVRTEVEASNYCGKAATPPIDIAFTLPSGGGHFVATPAQGVSSAEAVPLCLGSTGSAISMNGWTR